MKDDKNPPEDNDGDLDPREEPKKDNGDDKNFHFMSFSANSPEELRKGLEDQNIPPEDIEEIMDGLDHPSDEEYDEAEPMELIPEKMFNNLSPLNVEWEKFKELNTSFYGFLMFLSQKEVEDLCLEFKHVMIGSEEGESGTAMGFVLLDLYYRGLIEFTLAEMQDTIDKLNAQVVRIKEVKNGFTTYISAELDKDWEFINTIPFDKYLEDMERVPMDMETLFDGDPIFFDDKKPEEVRQTEKIGDTLIKDFTRAEILNMISTNYEEFKQWKFVLVNELLYRLKIGEYV